MCVKQYTNTYSAVIHDEELIPTSNSQYLKAYLITIWTQNLKDSRYPFLSNSRLRKLAF